MSLEGWAEETLKLKADEGTGKTWGAMVKEANLPPLNLAQAEILSRLVIDYDGPFSGLTGAFLADSPAMKTPKYLTMKGTFSQILLDQMEMDCFEDEHEAAEFIAFVQQLHRTAIAAVKDTFLADDEDDEDNTNTNASTSTSTGKKPKKADVVRRLLQPIRDLVEMLKGQAQISVEHDQIIFVQLIDLFDSLDSGERDLLSERVEGDEGIYVVFDEVKQEAASSMGMCNDGMKDRLIKTLKRYDTALSKKRI